MRISIRKYCIIYIILNYYQVSLITYIIIIIVSFYIPQFTNRYQRLLEILAKLKITHVLLRSTLSTIIGNRRRIARTKYYYLISFLFADGGNYVSNLKTIVRKHW